MVNSTRGQKWQHAVHKAKIGRYAVREGKAGVTLIVIYKYDNIREFKLSMLLSFVPGCSSFRFAYWNPATIHVLV